MRTTANALVIYGKTLLALDRYTTMDRQRHLSLALSLVRYPIDMLFSPIFSLRSVKQPLIPKHLVIYYPSALVVYDKKSIGILVLICTNNTTTSTMSFRPKRSEVEKSLGYEIPPLRSGWRALFTLYFILPWTNDLTSSNCIYLLRRLSDCLGLLLPMV